MTNDPARIAELKALLQKADALPSVNRDLTDNIFSVLKMEHKEVSAHSAFLSYVFEDQAALKLFIRQVLRIHTDSNNISFAREYVFDGGRIDFVFWIDNKPVALEMKVWAGEQERQIERYVKFVTRYGGSENDIFFLTPVSKPSKTGQSVNITFSKDMYHWLGNIEACAHGDRKVLIKQYKDLIGVISGAYMDEIQKINIITDKKDFDNINKLTEARRLFAQKVLTIFFDYVRSNLEGALNTGDIQVAYRPAEYEQEAIAGYYHKTHYYPQLFYTVLLSAAQRRRLRLAADETVYYAVELSKSLYHGFTIRKNMGEKVNDPARYYGLCDFCAHGVNAYASKNNSVWIAYKYFQAGNGTFDFAAFNKNYFLLVERAAGDTKYKINESLQLNIRTVDTMMSAAVAFYHTGIRRLLEYAHE